MIYFVAYRHLSMPWLRIASVLAVYGPAVGVLLAVSTELHVMLLDRVARAHGWLAAVANPVTAGAVGGALAGVAPGAAARRSARSPARSAAASSGSSSAS